MPLSSCLAPGPQNPLSRGQVLAGAGNGWGRDPILKPHPESMTTMGSSGRVPLVRFGPQPTTIPETASGRHGLSGPGPSRILGVVRPTPRGSIGPPAIIASCCWTVWLRRCLRLSFASARPDPPPHCQEGFLTFFTCANDWADLKGETQLMAILEARYVLQPQKSPFRSMSVVQVYTPLLFHRPQC